MLVLLLHRAGLLYPTMLSVHVLLVSLLGTSVMSLPVIPSDSPAIQVSSEPLHVQSSLPPPHALPYTPPHTPLHSPLWPPIQVPHSKPNVYVHYGQDGGEESNEPILVPDSLHTLIDFTSPGPPQTLLLNKIELYCGLWYREPTNVSATFKFLTFNQISVYLT